MKICVIGSGYVGLITACGFAKLGHSVSCVDIDPKKVEMINNGEPPIYENGLEELLSECAYSSAVDAPVMYSSKNNYCWAGTWKAHGKFTSLKMKIFSGG